MFDSRNLSIFRIPNYLRESKEINEEISKSFYYHYPKDEWMIDC